MDFCSSFKREFRTLGLLVKCMPIHIKNSKEIYCFLQLMMLKLRPRFNNSLVLKRLFRIIYSILIKTF